MAGTVPVISGSTAVDAGTKPASSFLDAWASTPDVPPPPPSQKIFDATTVKGPDAPMEHKFQVSHSPTMNNSSKTPIAVGFEGWTSYPHSDVCSQWKRKLREDLAYTILNYEEKTLAVNVYSAVSDETCAAWLDK
jgi:hypothetical protein